VLQWVASGSPDGVWTDFTYKTVAYGLAGRHLVVVERRRNSWRASITAQGTYYLQHGRYPPADTADRRRPPSQDTAKAAPERIGPPVSVSPRSLMDHLQADGTVTLTDPTAFTRAAYRSAISRAITEGLVPDGYALRHSGRDRGDLVIRLVVASELPVPAEKLPEIVLPENLAGCHEVVRMLGEADDLLLHVSQGARPRALRIAQAIADECGQRGYGFGLRDDGKPSFRITIGEDHFDFALSEELDRRVVPDEEKLAAAKYSWQRIPSAAKDLPSGRLTLLLGHGYGSVSWGDRKRWSLEQKLPVMFKTVADRAAAHAQERADKEAEKQRRHREWEVAVPRARQAYIDELNRDRLRAQVSSSAEAEAVRQYCMRLDKLAADCLDKDDAARIRAWAAWARQEADRVDPLTDPEKLGFEIPEEIRTYDLDKFMPGGMQAWRPPD
jgi:hypothetical protein